MRRWIPFVAIIVAGCWGSGGDAELPPAARLSLAELAAANVKTTLQGVDAAEPREPTVYRTVIDAVSAGELSVLDADRMLMPLFFGDRSSLSGSYASPQLAGMPDLALFWMLGRLAGYPPEIRAELEAWLPKSQAEAVAAAANRWRLFSPRAAYAVTAEPSLGSCQSRTQAGSFVNLGENAVMVAGNSLRLAVCAPSPDSLAVATDVYAQAAGDLDLIADFFQGQGVQILASDNQPQVQIFLTPGPPVARSGDSASHGYMASCRDIAVNQNLSQCELEATVRHEVFHCLHMRSHGFSHSTIPLGAAEDRTRRGSWWGRVPEWVAEGSAVWAEDRFDAGVQANAEWSYHLSFADIPHYALDKREYSSGMFFNLVEQHLGDSSMRELLAKFVDRGINTEAGGPDADELEHVLPWPDTWYDFADAASGYQVLFDEGRPELQDFPMFPYETQSNCTDDIALGQESRARRQALPPQEGLVYDLDLPHLSVLYEIIEDIDGSAQYIDVGFAGDAAERMSQGDNVRVTAILKTIDADRVEDWTERWAAEVGDSEPILIPPDLAVEAQTDGRLRLCLTDTAEGCFDKPDSEIYRGLYEIDLIIANAGFGDDADLHGAMVVLPGAMPGWKGKRVELQPGYEQDQ